MNKEEIESLKNDVLEEIDMLEHDADWLKAVADELRKKLKAVETEQDADEFNKYSESQSNDWLFKFFTEHH